MINSLLFYGIPEFLSYDFWSNHHSSKLAKNAIFRKYKIHYYLDTNQIWQLRHGYLTFLALEALTGIQRGRNTKPVHTVNAIQPLECLQTQVFITDCQNSFTILGSFVTCFFPPLLSPFFPLFLVRKVNYV